MRGFWAGLGWRRLAWHTPHFSVRRKKAALAGRDAVEQAFYFRVHTMKSPIFHCPSTDLS
jgi:hypothetical protein